MAPTHDGAPDARFIRETGLTGEIAALAEPVLVSMGFRLVRVQISGRDGQTVQIMAERPDADIRIEDCEALSRALSPLLDAFDPLPGSYRLEVSSPGIDRPLVRATDFSDWRGCEAKIELKAPVRGRKRFRGVLEGIEEDEVRMSCLEEQGGRHVVAFPLDLIAEAKLVLTDELVRETLRRAKRGHRRARAGAISEVNGEQE